MTITEIDRWKESDSLMRCRVDDLKAENERLRGVLDQLRTAFDASLGFETPFLRAERNDSPIILFKDAIEWIDEEIGQRAALGDRHE